MKQEKVFKNFTDFMIKDGNNQYSIFFQKNKKPKIQYFSKKYDFESTVTVPEFIDEKNIEDFAKEIKKDCFSIVVQYPDYRGVTEVVVSYTGNKKNKLEVCEKMCKIYELLIDNTKNTRIEDFCLKKQKKEQERFIELLSEPNDLIW